MILMILADKLSGNQQLTFFNTKALRYSTKFTIDTPNSLVEFVVESDIDEEWHADFV